MAGRPLAIRLAAVLAAVVVVVLVLAGIVVNQAASRSLDETLNERDHQRVGLAVALVDEALQRGIDGRALQMLVQRLAVDSGGNIRVRDDDGTVLAEGACFPEITQRIQRHCGYALFRQHAGNVLIHIRPATITG